MRWSVAEAAKHIDGAPHGEALVTSVSVDSRTIAPGGLFVALRGERADGHDHVEDAVARGAAAAVVETGRLPEGLTGIEVADPLRALGSLAAARRAELRIPVVAITGSSGKTTTKDLIAAVLGDSAHAAPSSYNNEIGVPLTVLSCPDDASALVLEVGSRGVGHIKDLGPVVRPDVSVITNVGPAHLEMFGDLDTVRKAKWELVELLGEDGVAVLPADDPELMGRHAGSTITFGEAPDADVAVRNVAVDSMGRPSFTLAHAHLEARIDLGISGRHQAVNSAAAVASALALGRDFEESARRLAAASLSPWRMEITVSSVGSGDVVIVNDAYNANPASVEAALRTVVEMPGRHVAVLGMMHELGEASSALHASVGRRASDLGFEVIVVGEDPGIAEGAPGSAVVANPEEAAEVLKKMLQPGDVVLVKASRAAGLERLPELIGGGEA